MYFMIQTPVFMGMRIAIPCFDLSRKAVSFYSTVSKRSPGRAQHDPGFFYSPLNLYPFVKACLTRRPANAHPDTA